MKNEDLRKEARLCGVCFWEIAKELGISEATMTRRLRYELESKQKAEIREIICRLNKEGRK